ncbi:hypothetical protein USDA257_c39500 [Sinorhizobium fredii USDA 257]|uniref:Uncharacterized protein n=1 Tax=Sinorhizobium fredii (strain USDA 257) TaxID=1185652 RepID=I3X9D8_SINF2|nr:hypothetical protein USDA257_c39500 [Sinorhizobium fredii USDA 257]
MHDVQDGLVDEDDGAAIANALTFHVDCRFERDQRAALRFRYLQSAKMETAL